MSRDSKAQRRDEIVNAAIEVLRSEGVAACTTRRIADETTLTKSSLHYYFEDINEVVDLAMGRLMRDYSERIAQAASEESDPAAALWAAARTFLVLGTARPRRIPMLWFEYVITAVRRNHTPVVKEMLAIGERMWGELVAATGVDSPETVARTLDAAMVGSVYQQVLQPRDVEDVLRDLFVGLGIPLPEGRE